MRDVVTKASIPSSARRLLDLGGGHGAHAIAFAKAHPALSATVFDVAESAPSAERLIAAEAMQERVKFETGDFWYDDIGAGYDVVFLANVVHGYRADQNQKLFEIVAKALSPGGRVIVLEQLPREKQMGKVGAALASLMAINMFLSREAETYSADRIGAWMRTAGFVDTRVKRFVRTPGLGLVIAKLSS
jgi:SAM-dependent methyltransferase